MPERLGGRAVDGVDIAQSKQALMCLHHDIRRLDRQLTRRAASCDSPWTRQVLPTVESAAERPPSDVVAGASIGVGSALLVQHAPRLLLRVLL